MAMRARISWATLAAILVAAVSGAVTLHLIDYPLGAAWDEFVKLRGVSTGRYRYYHPPLLLIASFAVLWYAVHEATPLKPFPDFSRYMLPLVPLFLILGTSFIYEFAARWDHRGHPRGHRLGPGRGAGAVDVRADQCTGCRSARRRAFDRRGKWRARHFRPLFRLTSRTAAFSVFASGRPRTWRTS
jgi:hypothetical protein